jgi:hypothetical protein
MIDLGAMFSKCQSLQAIAEEVCYCLQLNP